MLMKISVLRVMILLLSALLVTMFMLHLNNSAYQMQPANISLNHVQVASIQNKLKETGVYHDAVSGVYEASTQRALMMFQKDNNLTPDGVPGFATLKKLDVAMNTALATQEASIKLLARFIGAQAPGKPFEAQVAVGAVIINRMKHPSFPDSLPAVIYQMDPLGVLLTEVSVINTDVYQAAAQAFYGFDPTGGALYVFDSDVILTLKQQDRTVIREISSYLFCV